MKERKTKTDTLKAVTPSGVKDENFFEQAYAIARQIPKGKVTSYGAIAKCIGTGKSARMVGWALNNCNHIKPKVPAHRVVNSQGLLTGRFHFATITEMEELLRKEGVRVNNNKVIDFKNKFWNPIDELFT